MTDRPTDDVRADARDAAIRRELERALMDRQLGHEMSGTFATAARHALYGRDHQTSGDWQELPLDQQPMGVAWNVQGVVDEQGRHYHIITHMLVRKVEVDAGGGIPKMPCTCEVCVGRTR